MPYAKEEFFTITNNSFNGNNLNLESLPVFHVFYNILGLFKCLILLRSYSVFSFFKDHLITAVFKIKPVCANVNITRFI